MGSYSKDVIRGPLSKLLEFLCKSSLLTSSIFLRTLFPNALNLYSSLKARDQVSQLYNTAGNKSVCVPMPTHCTITCFGFRAKQIDGVECGLFSIHAPLGQTTLSVGRVSVRCRPTGGSSGSDDCMCNVIVLFEKRRRNVSFVFMVL